MVMVMVVVIVIVIVRVRVMVKKVIAIAIVMVIARCPIPYIKATVLHILRVSSASFERNLQTKQYC